MIHIVGLGGVGFWLATSLTRNIPAQEITCWDDDTLTGGTGSARLPWAPAATTKVDLLQGYLIMVLGDSVTPVCIPRKFSGLTGITPGDTILDCTDMPLSRRKRMWAVSKGKGARLLRVSYDGRGSTVIVSTGLPFLVPPEGGYTAIPSLGLSYAAGGIGSEVVRRYLEKPTANFTVSLSLEEMMS